MKNEGFTGFALLGGVFIKKAKMGRGGECLELQRGQVV